MELLPEWNCRAGVLAVKNLIHISFGIRESGAEGIDAVGEKKRRINGLRVPIHRVRANRLAICGINNGGIRQAVTQAELALAAIGFQCALLAHTAVIQA